MSIKKERERERELGFRDWKNCPTMMMLGSSYSRKGPAWGCQGSARVYRKSSLPYLDLADDSEEEERGKGGSDEEEKEEVRRRQRSRRSGRGMDVRH